MKQAHLSMEESVEISCEILLQLIRNPEYKVMRNIILDDFLWKSQYLIDDATKRRLRYEAMKPFVSPKKIVKCFEHYDKKDLEMRDTKTTEVLIIMAIEEELRIMKHILGVEEEKTEIIDGFRFWKTSLENCQNKQYEVVLTMLGEPGQHKAAASCSTIFGYYKPKLAILCGVCAGEPEETNLGDVLIVKHVLDHRPGVVTPEGKKPRTYPYTSSVQIDRDVNSFEFPENEFYEEIVNNVRNLREKGISIPEACDNIKPEIDKKAILVPEDVLVRDGRLSGIRDEFHDYIRGLEMECAGFAEACRQKGIDWVIFRGVMDFGNPEKTDSAKYYSALTASIVTRQFIKKSYCKPDEIF